ncbi:MAG: NTP transferase domain-containing protein [Pirellulales bacterium]
MSEAVAVVLAAGKGTRMESELPKVLVEACGRPLVEYVLEALDAAGVGRKLVVVGYRAALVRETLAGRPGVEFVEQTQQLGTGHAVMVCRDQLAGYDGPVVIVTGDSPMIQTSSVRRLLDEYTATRAACVMGTLVKDDPTGLGRIVRDERGEFIGIVEEKDASVEQRAIREVNMSTYVFDCQRLLGVLGRLGNDNRQGEYYITDCPGLLKRDGLTVRALPVLQPCEALSVNNLRDLAVVEAAMQAGV